MSTLADVFAAIQNELSYQTMKWGADKEQSLAGYLLIMRKELDEAIDGWMKNRHDPRQSSLEEVTQVAAVAVRCLMTYGLKGCSRARRDVTEEEMREERRQASIARFGAE